MHWFYDVKLGVPKVNHLKIGIFFDGFPLFRFPKRPGTILAIQLLNLIGLVQIPKYMWIKFFIVASENSPGVWVLLYLTDDEVVDLAVNGLPIEFPNVYGDLTIPQTTETFSGKPDGKALLALNGSKTANMMYPSPYYKIGKDSLMNLSINVREKATTLQQRRNDFREIYSLRKTNLKLYAQENALILKNKKLSSDEKSKQLRKLQEKLLETGISAKAAVLKHVVFITTHYLWQLREPPNHCIWI